MEKNAIDTIIIANMLDTKVDAEKRLKKKQHKKNTTSFNNEREKKITQFSLSLKKKNRTKYK